MWMVTTRTIWYLVFSILLQITIVSHGPDYIIIHYLVISQ